MPKEAWRAYLDLALGLTESSRKQATATAMKLVGRGGATAVQLQALVEDALAAGTANRAVVERLVRNEVDRALTAVGLATSDDVAALKRRIAELEDRLAARPADVPGDLPVAPAVEAEVAASVANPAPVTVKKVVAKKALAKKAVAKAPAAPAEDEPVVQTPAGAPAAPVPPPRKAAKKVPAAKGTPPAKKAVPTPADLPPAVKKAPAKRARKAVPPLFDDGTGR